MNNSIRGRVFPIEFGVSAATWPAHDWVRVIPVDRTHT